MSQPKDFIPKKAGVEDKVDDVPGHVFIADKPSEDPSITCYMKPDTSLMPSPSGSAQSAGLLAMLVAADDTY